RTYASPQSITAIVSMDSGLREEALPGMTVLKIFVQHI
ncbi:MAG: hypothetical protein QOD09_2589, partial [Bradyrhizobium sp.]|nr:hypothetical protein [Bradyrhizobium sp.]